MKALFFGTSAFAVPSLRAMAASTQLAGVVTQPDRPAGRGHKLAPSPVKRAALELGLQVHEPERLKEFAAALAGEDFDLFALASYGRVLPQALLDLPRLGSLNVHPSLLPKYRGATPIQTALRNGDAETGVTIMLMDAGLDTGDVVSSERVTIGPDETYGELHDRLARLGADLLAGAVAIASERDFLPHAAQRGEPVLTKPIAKDDLVVDLAWPAQRVVDAVRAYSPQPAARATIDGETVKLLRAHVGAGGTLAIDELIAPNRGRMSWTQYEQSRRASSA
ncbi:MAG: methionyl-tRNA formyltransferase [Candidatus Eremiobacteraeota bacterium]|nr:methionyl-tRNA formyltransferase [Candidatus Eremiobacteraeota bacterium]